MSTPILFAWSSGKDSAMALHQILRNNEFKVTGLLTTVTEEYGRVSMHGVRESLLEVQADALGLPLEKVMIHPGAGNDDYEKAMKQVLQKHQALGVGAVAFGDIFLEDLRAYREKNMQKVGMEAVFPIWKQGTRDLSQAFVEQGFKAIVTCVDTQALDGKFAGRPYDNSFLADLPPDADPCGENGEFHTFVYAGPVFDQPLSVRKGKIVLREERFCFCDVLPA